MLKVFIESIGCTVRSSVSSSNQHTPQIEPLKWGEREKKWSVGSVGVTLKTFCPEKKREKRILAAADKSEEVG